jgi:hypothetical protein
MIKVEIIRYKSYLIKGILLYFSGALFFLCLLGLVGGRFASAGKSILTKINATPILYILIGIILIISLIIFLKLAFSSKVAGYLSIDGDICRIDDRGEIQLYYNRKIKDIELSPTLTSQIFNDDTFKLKFVYDQSLLQMHLKLKTISARKLTEYLNEHN